MAAALVAVLLAAPAAAVLASEEAPAESPAIAAAVQWEAPAECPDDAAVESRIGVLVGEPPVPTPATARVEKRGDRYDVELVTWIDGGSQRRELSATSCDALADAVAVVIAVALDPVETVVRVPEPTRTATQTAPSEEGTRGTADATRTAKVRGPRKPLRFGLGVAAGYGSGVARNGSAITQLGFELGRRGWAVQLDARLWLPRTVTSEDPRGAARVLLGTFGVLGCGRAVLGRRGRVELPACAGLELGGLRAQGRSPLRIAGPQSYPWVAPRVKVGLRVELGRGVGLAAGAEGAVPVARALVNVGGVDPGTLWSTRAVSIRVMLGLDLRWWR